MAMTLVKSIKKRNDGRPAAAINRQGSIQAAINSSAIPKFRPANIFDRLVYLYNFYRILLYDKIMPTQFEGAASADDNDQAPKYENSYRLESNKPFNVDPVDKIISQVMTNNLEDIVYDPKECPKLCAEISADIRDRIRKQNFDRYKIVVIVTINEKASQGIQASMRFLWDVQRDNYSSFTFETRTFFAYCCVFGVYCE